MTLPIKKFREVIFLLLYCSDLSGDESEGLIEMLSKELKVSKKHVREAGSKMRLVKAKQPEIDAQIASETHSYEFKRIYSIERNILRLGLYEMLYDDTVPPKVAIAEAMRLGKKFGTPASVAFINAIMDHLYKLDQGESPDPQEVAKTLDQLVEDEKQAESIEFVDSNEQEPK